MFFTDRDEAGKRLAEALEAFRGQEAIVLGIPRGGVVIGYQVARQLSLPLDVMVTRKIGVPWSPETGFGAVGPDGSVILHEELMPYLGISPQEIDRLGKEVYAEVRRRMQVYRGERPLPPLKGKVVILTDDGLATGITLLAAIKSVRNQAPERVVAAIPVASGSGYNLVKPHVEELVCLYVHPEDLPFAVAAFYRVWTDMTDEEVLDYLSRPTVSPATL